MFTGIIEEVGSVKKVAQQGRAMEITIHATKIMPGIKLGDSIAVNGICLTVTRLTSTEFSVDVMPETFRSTSLSTLKERMEVNLERAMPATGRFDGHFVTGHVDGVGEILKKEPTENAIYFHISIPTDFSKYIVMKGSVAIDGISLTVFGIEADTLIVSIIPHTAKETVLGRKGTGDQVNLETDMLAKYLYSFVHEHRAEGKFESKITEQFLQQNGF
ncbi:riboflavin synthase [Virgibacillus halodenitrificans]|uniref:riboflavin synthase n=1 Tax=Virgibacillus halodenitrificans TaxID=1482 RepID=UPI001EEEFF8F|nr:riboflavin synthase [Virgibacillus halodenitrificans]